MSVTAGVTELINNRQETQIQMFLARETMKTDMKIIDQRASSGLVTSLCREMVLQNTPELDVRVDWLLLLLSSLVCGCLCTSAWAHSQFALTSPKTKLLSRIPTAGMLETEAQKEFVFCDSARAPLLDGRAHQRRCDVQHQEAEAAPHKLTVSII